MKLFIHRILLIMLALSCCYSVSSFSAPQCQQYEFQRHTVFAKTPVTYTIETENFEHTSTFTIGSDNTETQGVSGNILGFSLTGRDQAGNVIMHCTYGVDGAVMQNPGESVACPKMNEEVDKEINNTICKFYLPSSV
jgi:hypothetical protein